jgi:hypothetical protein
MAIRIVLNRSGIKQILNSPGVKADLRARAQRIAAAAGDGNEVTEASTTRARYVVVTATAEAMADEAHNRSLTRAIDAAR